MCGNQFNNVLDIAKLEALAALITEVRAARGLPPPFTETNDDSLAPIVSPKQWKPPEAVAKVVEADDYQITEV